MLKTRFSCAALVALLAAGGASGALAATVSASDAFAGDLCSTDVASAGGFDDCATIQGNNGVRGVYDFLLTGLDPAPTSDVTIRLTSTSADLFNVNGTNNSIERFRLLIGGTNFGRLFDRLTEDETAINAQLGASVQQNILDNIARPVANRSTGPIDLQFDISASMFRSLLSSDNSLTISLDFRQDQNINRFSDPTVSVSYQVADVNTVPLPATGWMLIAGVGGLAAVKRRKKKA